MPSHNKLLERARYIVKRDKELFDALIEFEKTKKMRSKERMNFTIDKSLASQFKHFCKRHGYSMSAKVEHAISSLMEDNGKPGK